MKVSLYYSSYIMKKIRDYANKEQYKLAYIFFVLLPYRAKKNIIFNIMEAYLLEKIHRYEKAMKLYNRALEELKEKDKINHDEKQYLLKFIFSGKKNIYFVKSEIINADMMMNELNSIKYDISNIKPGYIDVFSLLK